MSHILQQKVTALWRRRRWWWQRQRKQQQQQRRRRRRQQHREQQNMRLHLQNPSSWAVTNAAEDRKEMALTSAAAAAGEEA
jgi:hypothetical protein